MSQEDNDRASRPTTPISQEMQALMQFLDNNNIILPVKCKLFADDVKAAGDGAEVDQDG